MSKKATKPLIITNVIITISNHTLKSHNKNGNLTRYLKLTTFYIVRRFSFLFIFPINNNSIHTPLWGTYFTVISNTLSGLSRPYKKRLQLLGTGYTASILTSNLILSLGFTHSISISLPSTINASILSNTIKLISIDNIVLGNFTSKLLSLKKFNHYKGKGLKLSTTTITLKRIQKK